MCGKRILISIEGKYDISEVYTIMYEIECCILNINRKLILRINVEEMKMLMCINDKRRRRRKKKKGRSVMANDITKVNVIDEDAKDRIRWKYRTRMANHEYFREMAKVEKKTMN